MAISSKYKHEGEEISLLLARARGLCFPDPYPSTVQAAWLLEGSMGDAVWKTKNGGKEYFDNGWQLTRNASFDRRLPDLSSLTEVENKKCLDSIQKWAFAYRSGWLERVPGPKAWIQAVNWSLLMTSWVYLDTGKYQPKTEGFSLVDEDDLALLMEALAVDGWASALRLRERVFSSLFLYSFGKKPEQQILDQLPKVDPEFIKKIADVLGSEEKFTQYTSSDQKLISRKFIADLVGCSARSLDAVSVRSFLRQFEMSDNSSLILLPGAIKTAHPSQRLVIFDDESRSRLTKQAMLQHATNCTCFWSGHVISDIGIPMLDISTKVLIKDLEVGLEPQQHQKLIPLSEAVSALNEAAQWISNYGDQLVEILASHLVDRAIIDLDYPFFENTAIFHLRNEAYAHQRARHVYRELLSKSGNDIFNALGLQTLFDVGRRVPVRGSLSLSQAISILIGACAYSIALMKPMRDGELSKIEYDCVSRIEGLGCFLKVPVEKAGDLGVLDDAMRPIPFLTYKAVTILQKIGDLTAQIYYGVEAKPDRLFLFPSGNGFAKPVDKAYGITIDRCMDWFCEYVDFPLDVHGRRHYFRVHELRKFFLLMITWDDRMHGWECGAWMAAHRDADYMQAYTEANWNGAEISKWEAEYVEHKILEIECGNATMPSTGFEKLYNQIRDFYGVEKIATLTSDKYKSYVSEMLATRRFELIPLSLPAVDGRNTMVDLALIAREMDNEKK